jgi:hypothetical protein
MLLWSIGVEGARRMGSLWTIFFSIVRLLAPYGTLSLVALGGLGLCLVGGLIYLLAGRWWSLS